MKPILSTFLFLASLSWTFGQGNLRFTYTVSTNGSGSVVEVYVTNVGTGVENMASYTMNLYYDNTESTITQYDIGPTDALGWMSLPSRTFFNAKQNPNIPIPHTGFGNINLLDFSGNGTHFGTSPTHILSIHLDNTPGTNPGATVYLSSSSDGHLEQVYNDNGNGNPIPNAFPVIVEEEKIFPVDWLSFQVEALENIQSLLSWTTSSEHNNRGFEIQRAPANVAAPQWKSIGFVKGKGNVSTPTSYSFTDEQPQIGKNLYRLKQMDFNGGHSHSEVREVTFKEQANLLIHPNPTADIVEVRLIGYSQDTEASYQLFDIKGRLIQRGALNPLGENQIDLGNLSDATYLLWVFHNGKSTETRIVKKGS